MERIYRILLTLATPKLKKPDRSQAFSPKCMKFMKYTIVSQSKYGRFHTHLRNWTLTSSRSSPSTK